MEVKITEMEMWFLEIFIFKKIFIFTVNELDIYASQFKGLLQDYLRLLSAGVFHKSRWFH